jgi:hypothetical protein
MESIVTVPSIRRSIAAIAALLLAATAAAEDPPKNLSSYLTDVNSGVVAAGSLVGLSETAISQIQTSQDLVIALKPLASGQSKAGFGLAVTPARTAILPIVSARDYYSSSFSRFLANFTFSYAENTSDIAGVNYRKSAFSVDTYLYLDPKDDPVVKAYDRFGNCPRRVKAENDDRKARIDRREARRMLEAAKTTEEKEKAQEAIDAAEAVIKQAAIDANSAHKNCVDDALKEARWNASRLSVSFGGGWIKPDDNSSSRRSLGRTFTFGGMVATGEQGATNLALRHTAQEVDLTTLGGAPAYKSSTLGVARYTYGSNDEKGKWRALAEASTARKSDVTLTNRVYKYALGMDAKVSKGMWVEFRLGKNRSLDGTSDQTTSLLTLNIAPSSTLFGN